nr:uncharacterized protein LOC106678111 [Halyomorpha halys]
MLTSKIAEENLICDNVLTSKIAEENSISEYGETSEDEEEMDDYSRAYLENRPHFRNTDSCGWRPIEEYFYILQRRIRKDENIFKYNKAGTHLYNAYFSIRENLAFSLEDVLLATELFNRLIMQDFIKKIGDCVEMEGDVHLNEEKWVLTLQRLDQHDFLSFLTCLILARKVHDLRFKLPNPMILEIIYKAKKEVTTKDLAQHEFKVLEELNYTVSLTKKNY